MHMLKMKPKDSARMFPSNLQFRSNVLAENFESGGNVLQLVAEK